jgi:hypothetical protein
VPTAVAPTVVALLSRGWLLRQAPNARLIRQLPLPLPNPLNVDVDLLSAFFFEQSENDLLKEVKKHERTPTCGDATRTSFY